MKGKLKVMKSRPEVSDEEIRNSMDFEKLLTEKQKFEADHKQRRNRNAMLLIAGFILLSASLYYIVYRPFQGATAENVESPGGGSGLTGKNPTSTDAKVDDEPEVRKNNEPSHTTTKTGENSKRDKTDETKIPVAPPQESSRQKKGTDVYEQASPVNGYPALYEYFNNELRYPQVKETDSVDGVVTVIFTIDKTGKPVNIQVENSLGSEFDREAIRVIEKMLDWNPARFNGQPVPSKISVPLTFETQKVIIK
jgi:TonB family protein